MQDTKNKKAQSKDVKCRAVPWVDATEPNIAYIRTDLPPPDICTMDPVPSGSAKNRKQRR